jgi:hypothetical protein
MARLIVRLLLLAGGLGATEIGLVTTFGREAPIGWLAVALGMVLLVAGSAGFMAPLLRGSAGQGDDR